jgi:hypothetical protein
MWCEDYDHDGDIDQDDEEWAEDEAYAGWTWDREQLRVQQVRDEDEVWHKKGYRYQYPATNRASEKEDARRVCLITAFIMVVILMIAVWLMSPR